MMTEEMEYEPAEIPAIHHWILCRSAVVESPAKLMNQYSLFGVGFRFAVESQVGPRTTFPKPLDSLCIFARFYGGLGTRAFEIQVAWLDGIGSFEETIVEVYGPFTVHFREHESVRDYVFTLRNVPILGPGRYAILLYDLDIPIFGTAAEPLAVEYFEVADESEI